MIAAPSEKARLFCVFGGMAPLERLPSGRRLVWAEIGRKWVYVRLAAGGGKRRIVKCRRAEWDGRQYEKIAP